MSISKMLFPMQITRRIYIWICLLVICTTAVQVVVVRGSFLSAEKVEREKVLLRVASSLERHLQNDVISQLLALDAAELPVDAQVSTLNRELQPVLDRTALNHPDLGIGVYSIKLDSVLAIWPFDSQLLTSVSKDLPYFNCYQTGEPDVIQTTTSLSRDGSAIMAVTYPIKLHGEVIGHTWANVKMNDVYAAAWQNAARTVLTGTMLLIIILLATWWFFLRFQQELQNFASAVAQGESGLPKGLLPELNPLLDAIQDHTHRLEEEIAAKNRTQRELNSFFNASPDLITVSSIQGKLQRVNPAVKQILGYEPEEYVSIPLLERTHPDDVQSLQETVCSIGKGQSVTHYETRYRCKDGSYKWIAWSAVSILDEGLIVAVGRDMTSQKQWEKDMLRLDRLNLAAQMAASISHEIRNPMTTVRGYLQLFGKKDEYRAYREHFELMIDELDRANSIISEFLSVARNRATDLKSHDLNHLIRLLHPLLQADANLAKAQTVLRLSPVSRLQLDEKEIRQLLLNLVRNAVEAMPKGGTVTISTWERDGRVLLEVKDEGTGIPEEIQDRIGSPFFSTKDNGTGLGLAVCYRIVEEHRAQISFESSQQGTAFRVCFLSDAPD